MPARLVTVIGCLAFCSWLLHSANFARGPAERSTGQPALRSPFRFARWETVDDLPLPLAIYETVFWEPDDTVSLRQLILETPLVRGKRVLEIGTGSGLIALCCLAAGATSVVATDINPAAVACAVDNARQLNFAGRLDVRSVSEEDPSAYAVLRPRETFDLIISNPPWENAQPRAIDEFALYDPGFELLASIIVGAKSRLKPGGKLLLAYGCVEAIQEIQRIGSEAGFRVKLLDERRLDDLEPVFLPGMLIELTPLPWADASGTIELRCN